MINFMIEENTIKIDEGNRRTGKDEMNLIELPFTLLSKRNPKDLKTIKRIWKGKGEDGREREFHKIITSSDEWGLPTFIGEEVYLACMELSYKQGFKRRKVNTTQYELIKLMNWKDDGRSYKRLIKAFNQLGGIWITTNAFWDNQEKKYRKIGFGVIDDYIFYEEEKKGRKSKYNISQLTFPFGYFNWNETFFNESLQKGNIKTLNTGLYFSLNSYISKRLYRFADKKLYKQQSFELDLFRLAFEKMEMIGEAYRHPSKIIQNLQPAIKELKERGIINITIKESKTESGYKVCFNPSNKQKITIPLNIQEKNGDSEVTELINYFHTKLDPQSNHQPIEKEIKQAEDLISKYTQEEIKHIINYAIDKAEETNYKMQYFGAVLNYTEKALNDLKKKKERQAKELQQKEEDKLKEQYKKFKQEIIDKHFNQLSPEEYQQEIKKYSDRLSKENPIIGNNKGYIHNQIIKNELIEDLIKQGKIKIQSFKDWKTEKNKQI